MKKVVLLCCFLVFCFAGCKKNQLGGKSTIKGMVMHHEKVIANAIVYIKFKATEFPGSDVSKYDNKYVTDATGSYSFKCYKGDYYLYATGYDNGIKENVQGGIPVHLRNNETVEITVPVTED